MLKESYKIELINLAGKGVSLDDMINEAVRRFIEYSQEENITKYCKIENHEMLLAFSPIEYDAK